MVHILLGLMLAVAMVTLFVFMINIIIYINLIDQLYHALDYFNHDVAVVIIICTLNINNQHKS